MMPWVKQEEPLYVMQPLVRLMPFAKVEVLLPYMVVEAVEVPMVRMPPVKTFENRFVVVALVLVLFASVMFWKEVAPVKEFVPVKVLLLAKSVDDAAVIAALQPNTPPLYDSACEALLQVLNPAAKKLVV